MVKTKRKLNIINSISSFYKTANKVYKQQVKNYNNMTLAEVDRLTGEQFELLLANLFTLMGYTVRTTPTTGDYGADLLLFNQNTLTVVQANLRRGSINSGSHPFHVSTKGISLVHD